jgi:2-polyprenyl-3-methyl-5-hydroxy-6-metoxy-1,4-benzoquinol methylase
VHAIDANPLAIEFARRAYGRGNVSFHLALADEIAFPNESIDAVYSLEFVEHVYPEQASAIFARLRPALKPGGRVVITTPNYRSLWPLIEKGMDLLRLAPEMEGHQHVWRPTRRTMALLARHAGYAVVRAGRSHGVAPFAAVFGRRIAEVLDDFENRWRQPLGNLLWAVWKRF